MCGRYTLKMTPDELKRLFRYEETPNFPPRYNIAPTQPIAIVRSEHGARHFQLVRWGLIPSWTKDPSDLPLMINARSETAAEKPSFRGAMRHRRCIVPANGFYEWRRSGKEKQAFLIRRRDGGALAFAGLWEAWLGADGSEIDTGAILTTGANRLMQAIHDRMPVILPEETWDAWLDTDRHEPRHLAPLLRPAADQLLEAVPVSDRVGAVRNDDPGLEAPISEPLTVDGASETDVAGSDDKGEDRKIQGQLF